MNPTRILLIGILYLAQLIVADIILNEKILSDDKKPISCGSRWRNTGVKYKIYYPSKEQAEREMTEGPEDPEESEEFDEDEEDEDDDNSIISSMEGDSPTSSILGPLNDQEAQDVYEYCREENTKRVFYTKYKIEDPTKMTPASPQSRKQGPYEIQTSSTRSSLNISEVKRYYKNVIDYDSQLVVVPTFTPRYELMDGFYEYDISAPMNTELTKLWKKVIEEIRGKIHKIKEPIYVYSGTYDTYRLHGVPNYINIPKAKLPAPFAWWIMLYNQDETKGISVIMQNYAFSHGEEKKLLCEESICSKVGLKVPDYSYAQIYCCPANTILEEYEFTENEIKEQFDFH